MRNATELMVQYAAYHRDRRNIATHYVGVPLIVLGVGALLARPAFAIGGLDLTPGGLLFLAAAAWYLTRGDLVLGLATTAVVGLLVAVGHQLAALGTAAWLASAIGVFALGWVIQFIGHYYEGRKPAFVDDLLGLLVGPMFVVGEWLFALGWGKPMLAEIERRVGPTHLRDIAGSV